MKKTAALILIIAIISTLFSFCLTSCSAETTYKEGNGSLQVLCTSFAPFDFARNVGGERVQVSILQDSGADLHNYTPTAATLEAISKADLFIYIGGTSDENWIHDAIKASGNQDITTLCLMDYIDPLHAELENSWDHNDHNHENETGEDHDHKAEVENNHHDHKHEDDEHIWTSVKNAKIIVSAIKDAFSKIDPDGSNEYKKNADTYLAKLDSLDKELEAVMKKIPVMVFADRFPFVYLLHDYHVPYKAAFSGCSTEVNAGFEMQVTLIEAVKEEKLPCVFIIEGGSKDLADAISSETGCKIFAINSMQSIKRSDIVAGANYLDIMKDNVEILKEAYE